MKQKLINEINKPEIVVLTGMPQVGKTTLMYDIYQNTADENKVFLDLENPLNQRIFEEKKYTNILYDLIGFEVKINGDASDARRLIKTATSFRLKDYYIITKQFNDYDKIIIAQDL